MPPESTSGTGQVPPTSQSPDSNGQVPPVSQASSASGDDSANGSNPEPSSLSPEQLQDALKKAREQAAKYRVDGKELAELRAFKQQAEEAKLTDDQKRDKALTEARQRAEEAEARAQKVAVRAEARIAAAGLGIKIELALKLLEGLDVAFNEHGDPTNVAELLAKEAADLGIATSAPAAPSTNGAGNGRAAAPRQPTSVGSTPANPSRSATTGGPAGGWSWEAISSLTKAEYEGLTPAQRAAMSQFISTHPKH